MNQGWYWECPPPPPSGYAVRGGISQIERLLGIDIM